MMDYVYTLIQAEDGKLFQAQKMVSGFMKEETDPAFEIMVWEMLDQLIYKELGWLDRYRYGFEREVLMFQDYVFPSERYADDGHDRWPGNVVHILDGPLAGKDFAYNRHISSGRTLKIPVADTPTRIWKADEVPEDAVPLYYRTTTLSYNIHDRYGEYFGTFETIR